VLDRIGRIGDQAAALRAFASTGTVADNRTGALMAVFGSVALMIVGLVTSRDDLRARLRQATPTGVPVLAEARIMIAAYLTAERELGRVVADADVDTLALALIGPGHLLLAGREAAPLEAGAVRKVVTTVIAGVVREPREAGPRRLAAPRKRVRAVRPGDDPAVGTGAELHGPAQC
jgi:hypothetical protein